MTVGIFLVLPSGTSGGLLVVLLLLVGIAMFLCKGTYFSIQPEMGIPTTVSATAVAIATFVGYIPDMFVHTMFGNWIDAYGDAGYTRILIYGVGTSRRCGTCRWWQPALRTYRARPCCTG